MTEEITKILQTIEDQGLRDKLLKLHVQLSESMNYFPAGKKNHHTGVGDYGRHVYETMMIALKLYDMISEHKQLTFSKDDVILVAYVHDIDKIWRYEKQTDNWRRNKLGENWKVRDDVLGYDESAKVVSVCAQAGILLTDRHLEAICHHHGGWSMNLSTIYGYRPEMTHFSTLIHCADLMSGFILGR